MINYVQSWTRRTSWATSTTTTVTGATAGNLLMMQINSQQSNTVVPDDWTEIAPVVLARRVYWKIAAGDATDSVTCTHTSAQYFVLVVREYSGVDAGDPIDGAMSFATNDYGYTYGYNANAPFSVQATSAGRGVALWGLSVSVQITNEITTSSGDVEVHPNNVYNAFLPTHASDEIVTHRFTSTPSFGSSFNTYFLILLREAGGGPPPEPSILYGTWRMNGLEMMI